MGFFARMLKRRQLRRAHEKIPPLLVQRYGDDFVAWMQGQDFEDLSFDPAACSPASLGARYDALRAEASEIVGSAQFLPNRETKEKWDPLYDSSVGRNGFEPGHRELET